MLREVEIETVNLHTAFLALTVKLMEDKGQIVAIIPRSFCNGLYYKPFRKLLLENCSIEHIHIFDSRTQQFKDDEVLQENIILKLSKNTPQEKVTISHSSDDSFVDYKENKFNFTQIVKKEDIELFLRIPTETKTSSDYEEKFNHSINELGLNVSTGAVVDFRMKEFLLQNPTEDSILLLYPHHFKSKALEYPKEHKKPNALRYSEQIRKYLMPNDGYYVIVKRFSSKEENRRVVAYVVEPEQIESELIGFENHWNVFHINKQGISRNIARGLACFLNSSIVDEYFRIFSGHTQVNATDLKNMKYPSLSKIEEIGEIYEGSTEQNEIDQIIQMTI